MKTKLLRKVRKHYDWNLNITDRGKLATCALINTHTKQVYLCKDISEIMFHIALFFGKIHTYHTKRNRIDSMRLFRKYGKSKH